MYKPRGNDLQITVLKQTLKDFMTVPIREVSDKEVYRVDFVDVDIIVGGTSAVKNNPPEEQVALPAGKSAVRKDRRKNKQDRRRSVREGVIVSLSSENDRRILRERRKANS
jgi:hypothetical protein